MYSNLYMMKFVLRSLVSIKLFLSCLLIEIIDFLDDLFGVFNSVVVAAELPFFVLYILDQEIF